MSTRRAPKHARARPEIAVWLCAIACGSEPSSAIPVAHKHVKGEPPPLAGEVPSDAFDPRPERVRLEDLPAPFATESAERSPEVVAPPPDARLRVARGFAVQLFAADVPNARWLARAPDGRILVARSHDNEITALTDRDGDGVADERETFASLDNGVDLPFGMAFAPGAFYLGNQNCVMRFAFAPGQRRLDGVGDVIAELPGGGYHQHWTRNVVLAPDGQHLFVSIGSRTNAGPEDPPRASIVRMALDGSDFRIFATGLRNAVGLAFQPQTGALYATVNERDELGDDLVPDFFARIDEGAFYGWPYAYLAPDLLDPRRMRHGRSERPDLALTTRTPEVLFPSHSAALGVAFFAGHAFGAHYRGGAFVAHRGSWNRSSGTGYRIAFVPFDDAGEPLGTFEDFVTGFLIDASVPRTWGRPVGVLALDDAILFTDEPGGRVYRVVVR